MGVDKKDVGLVVHYDAIDSLENYISGRKGRSRPKLSARCYAATATMTRTSIFAC